MNKLRRALPAAFFAAFFLSGCFGPDFYADLTRPQTQYGHRASYSRTERPAVYGLPAAYSDFKAHYAIAGRSPQGAVKMYFDAIFSYIEGNKTEALKMLRYALHEGKGWERTQYHSTFMERLKDPSNHHIFRSFASGSDPENDYAMDPNDYSLCFAGLREMIGYTQVQLISSGADSPRTIQVRQFDDGLWYVTENAATYVQVRDPYSVRTQKMYRHDSDYD